MFYLLVPIEHPKIESKDCVKYKRQLLKHVQYYPWNSISLGEVRIKILAFRGSKFVVCPSHGIFFSMENVGYQTTSKNEIGLKMSVFQGKVAHQTH